MHVYFILAQTVKTLCKMNSSVFNYTSCYMLSTLGSLVSKEGLKEKETMVAQFFSFHLGHHFQPKYLDTKGNNKQKRIQHTF